MENRGMTKKIIKKVIKAKITDWLKSIDDEDLKEKIRKNTIVTGGCITSMLLGEKVKDFDIYFRTKEVAEEVARYYVSKFVKQGHSTAFEPEVRVTEDRVKIYVKSQGVAAEDPKTLENPFEDVYDVLEDAEQVSESSLEGDSKERYRPIFLSSNAITLANKVQIVVRFFGDADTIHENYDFVHCTNYYDSKEDKLVLRQEALECILSKELKYQGSKYPICSVIRTRKFLKRGWHINAGQYLKMLFQVSELNLKDISVLEDQLVGVDSAYFNALIRALESKQEKDPSFEISSSYIGSIVDKIF